MQFGNEHKQWIRKRNITSQYSVREGNLPSRSTRVIAGCRQSFLASRQEIMSRISSIRPWNTLGTCCVQAQSFFGCSHYYSSSDQCTACGQWSTRECEVLAARYDS